MIGPLKDVKRLIRKYAKAREPFHNIPADDWNEALNVLTQNRPLHLGSGGPRNWLHPWEITPVWDGALDEWRYEINPGFVNGESPTFSLPVNLAPEEFQETEERRVDVPLTGKPQPVIESSRWRAIGSDAEPVGFSSDAGALEVSLNFEGVPQFFQAIGVGAPPSSSFSQFGVTTQGVTNTPTRLLRAVDVVLTQPRPAVKADVSVGGGAVGGSFAQVDLVYEMPATRIPSITTLQRYKKTEALEDTALLAGSLQDDPWDKLHLATIYAVSPRGAKPGSTPDHTWTLHPKHHVFWNLNHGTNRIPQTTPFEPLTFPMYLAGGVGTLAVNSALAVINDNADLVLEHLRAARLEGRFWTT